MQRLHTTPAPGLRPAPLAALRPGRALSVRVAAPERSGVPQAAAVVPPSEEVAAKMAELGLDLESSGLKHLPNEARVSGRRCGAGGGRRSCKGAGSARALHACGQQPAAVLCTVLLHPTFPNPPITHNLLQLRAMDKSATKFEKIKNEKCGSHIWSEVTELAQLIRCGGG